MDVFSGEKGDLTQQKDDICNKVDENIPGHLICPLGLSHVLLGQKVSWVQIPHPGPYQVGDKRASHQHPSLFPCPLPKHQALHCRTVKENIQMPDFFFYPIKQLLNPAYFLETRCALESEITSPTFPCTTMKTKHRKMEIMTSKYYFQEILFTRIKAKE